MKIIETFMQGKRPSGIGCEDGYFISDAFAVVVDGATSHGDKRWGKVKNKEDLENGESGKASGEFAKDIILEQMEHMPVDVTAEQCMEHLHQALAEAAGEDVALMEQPRASLLVYSVFRKEIWSLGDCNFMVNDRLYYHEKKVDVCIAEIRSMLIHSLLAEGWTEKQLLEQDESRSIINELISRQYFLENIVDEYGYPELNCNSFEPSMIQVVKVGDGDEIVLATDGYPELYGTLKESEEALKVQLCDDPLMYKWHKSMKGVKQGNVSYDDRCYIRIKV